MNADVLERLLIDRALGALPADTAALLEAYLGDQPDTAAQAAQWSDVVGLTRRAWPRETATSLPPFPVLRVRAGEQQRRRWLRVQRYSGLAAALVIGVGVGSVLFRSAAFTQPEVPLARVVQTAGHAPGVRTEPAGGRFWSTSRLVAAAKPADRTRSQPVIWDSPAMKPRLRGEL